MTVDYDLVIIGGTAIARYAALKAARLDARVALVEPPVNDPGSHARSTNAPFNFIKRDAIAHLSRTTQIPQQQWLWGFASQQDNPQHLNWQDFLDWTNTAIDNLLEENQQSIALLAAAGVDVVQATGEFVRRPQLGFLVQEISGSRLLRSRSYLLAPALSAIVPNIVGLSEITYLTLDSFWHQRWHDLPHHLVILGNDPRSIEIAQALHRFGVRVTLLSLFSQLLPYEDQEVSRLIQVQLECEGIEILFGRIITRIEEQNRKKFIHLNELQDEHVTEPIREFVIEADELLLAIAPNIDLAHLNLQAIEVQTQRDRIPVDRKLQTSNPRVYACGEVLGGYPFLQLGQYEAEVAIHNALFLPTVQVNYRQIPWAIFTDPELARIGLTEAQARRLYGENIVVLRQPFKRLSKATIQAQTTGFCKLIARRNGEILGAHLVGIQASELIHAIAIAMQNKITLNTLTQSPIVLPSIPPIFTPSIFTPSTVVSSTCAEILQPLLQDWQEQRSKPWQCTLRETWLDFWRDRL